MKMEDTQYFAKLLEDVDEETLSADEQKERKIMRLLLKIKNGTPPMRKVRECRYSMLKKQKKVHYCPYYSLYNKYLITNCSVCVCVEFSDLWIFIFLPNVQIYGYIFFSFFLSVCPSSDHGQGS